MEMKCSEYPRPLILDQSGGNRKKCFREGCGFTFFSFSCSCFGLLSCTLTWENLFLKNVKARFRKGVQKTYFYFQASVTTLTDVFPTQQGKAYNFGFSV
jgi:hypothetical protein